MDIETKKIGFLRWESAVTIGRITYYFPGYTRKGAAKRAEAYIKERGV